MPACLRVQMCCAPWGETTSTPSLSSNASSSPAQRTCPGAIRTGPARRCIRSCRRSPSPTPHHDTGTPPIEARAAHAIPSGPKAPTQRQRFSGRPPRTSGMRAGGSGRSEGRPRPGPRHAAGGAVISARYPRGSGLTDGSIHRERRARRESRRRAAHIHAGPRPQPRGRGSPDPRRRAGGRDARRAAREVGGARHARADRRGRRAARRDRAHVGRGRRARARHRPDRRLDRRARRRRHARPQHLRALRPRRRGARDLPQDPHVRRRGRRPRLPRVGDRRAGRRGRALGDRRRRRARHERLLRPALPRALPRAGRPWGARAGRPRRVHARHHARALGGAPARPRDRGPGVRGRRQPDRAARPRHPLRRALDDRRPVGARAGPGAGRRDVRDRRSRPRAPGRDPPHAPVARQPPARHGGPRLVARNGAPDKRRIILDAAVRVFARQGFHTCRVSDIADEAQVAYGLVYHYFGSKDEVLDTLFVERWDILLEAIRETDATDIPAREKLYAIASFIVDSYRHDPELMKVIIVEVTRAANSFGRTHLPKIGEAYGLIADIVRKAQADGAFRDSGTPEFAAMAFYGAIEQVLTGWIFGLLEQGEDDYERAKAFVVDTICDGLEAHPSESSA